MIVVAIIGILAAVAIPQYQNYVARAQMAEALTLISGMKTPVAENIATSGTHDKVNNASLGITSLQIKGKYVKEVVISKGSIIATMREENKGVNKNIADKKIQLRLLWDEPTGKFTWLCESNVTAQYMPKGCSWRGI